MIRSARGRLRPASLAGRLALAMAALQAVVVLAGMAAWMLSSDFVTWNDVAASTAAALVADSLSVEAGEAAIRPSTALRAYAAQRPTLRYAASRNGAILPGSSQDLTAALARLGPALPQDGQLGVPLDGAGLAAFAGLQTPVGYAVVVTAGNRFRLVDDLGTYFSVYALQLLPMFGPAILTAAAIMPLAVRRLLRPIRVAAAEVETIDLNSLGRRLNGTGAPSELRPFLTAINQLLARLDTGVQRQRLFSANAAHELRTPAAILQVRIETLPDSDPVKAELLRDVRRITLLLDQLLAVARLGQTEAAPSDDVCLHSLAQSVVADMAPLAIRLKRTLALEPQGAAAPMRGNARALESAIGNLIDNALRAEPAGGTVVIATGPGARVAVTDHGPGIAAEDQPFVFDPFWRKSEHTTGTGLGLAIVREIARLHGGEASVISTPGKGATFALTFACQAQ